MNENKKELSDKVYEKIIVKYMDLMDDYHVINYYEIEETEDGLKIFYEDFYEEEHRMTYKTYKEHFDKWAKNTIYYGYCEEADMESFVGQHYPKDVFTEEELALIKG